jgi:hypothetical protein
MLRIFVDSSSDIPAALANLRSLLNLSVCRLAIAFVFSVVPNFSRAPAQVRRGPSERLSPQFIFIVSDHADVGMLSERVLENPSSDARCRTNSSSGPAGVLPFGPCPRNVLLLGSGLHRPCKLVRSVSPQGDPLSHGSGFLTWANEAVPLAGGWRAARNPPIAATWLRTLPGSPMLIARTTAGC